MAHYPADTFQEATEIAIEASNQLHGVINGDANTEVTVEDGSKIPSVRKAMVDSLYFKPPIAWAQGEYEDTYNQLREFVDGDVRTWWFAKGATVSTPVLMSTNPATDVNWTLWSAVTLNAATYETQKRLAAEAGLNMVGSFLLGATVTTTIDVVFYESDGKYYSWSGAFPKAVAAGSTPATSGGIGAGAWVDRSDVTLRSDINIVQKRFACVADMVADTTLAIGTLVETIGYYNGYWGTSVGDVGGNRYKIVATGTGISDGGAFITLSNGLQAKGLFPYDMPSDAQFGAKVDGVTDDLLAVKNVLAFSKNVRLIKGNRVISASIPFISQNIYGEGSQGGTIVTPRGKFSAFKYSGGHVNGGEIKGLMIDFGSSVPVLADLSIGIDYGASTDTNWPARYVIDDVYIRGATRAIQDDTGGWSGTYKRVWAQYCRLAFSKRAGTMTTYEQCFSDACLQAWLCVNAHTVTIRSCGLGTWNTENGAIIDFNGCPSFCVDALQVESGTFSDNGIFLRAYNNSNGKVNGVNLYNCTHKVSTGSTASVIYSYGENTNVSVSGFKFANGHDTTGHAGTLNLLAAYSQSKINADSSYLGDILGDGVILSAYTDGTSGAVIEIAQTVEYENGFSGDIRFGNIYHKNGVYAVSVTLAAGATVKYEVPISGLVPTDMLIATQTFQTQGEVITAAYYNSSFASIIITNVTSGSRTITGNIYVQVIRRFPS